eukprot:6589800-Ditylum_brightwellii.AAC.1
MFSIVNYSCQEGIHPLSLQQPLLMSGHKAALLIAPKAFFRLLNHHVQTKQYGISHIWKS